MINPLGAARIMCNRTRSTGRGGLCHAVDIKSRTNPHTVSLNIDILPQLCCRVSYKESYLLGILIPLLSSIVFVAG